MSNNNPVIAVTPGDPAGIGPDVLLKVAASNTVRNATLVAYADPQLLADRAALLKLPLEIFPLTTAAFDNEIIAEPGQPTSTRLLVFPIRGYRQCLPGQPNPANADHLLSALDIASSHCKDHIASALVTGPVNKHQINQGLSERDEKDFFSGHTEYLAMLNHTERVVMMLAGQTAIAKNNQLRVALATTHLPLAKVPQAINSSELEATLRILHRELCDHFGIDRPRILVCGLNPHAGEQGDLGREELEIINPVIEKLRVEQFDLSDALPADTLFTTKYLGEADAVLAMYHDQGLPVLKSHCFGRAANITLGLPIIRTSVDHGTAYDLAGTGDADSGSLETAINCAIDLARNRRQ